MAYHEIAQRVTFGDCDPAGIVFYPRFFAWFDRTFHDWLRGFGGHKALCDRLGAVGLGLISADAAFRSPARDGDELEVRMMALRWADRSLTVDYEIVCADRRVATGHEKRGVFLVEQGRMIAGDMLGLKEIVDGGG